MKASLRQLSSSRGFKWTLAGIVMLVALPFLLDYVSLPVLTYRGDSKVQYRDFNRYAKILDQTLKTAPPTNSLPFPEILRQEVDLHRAELFTTFSHTPNVRTAASSVVVCASKKVYHEGRLVLLRDGTVSFMRGDGTLVPYRNN